MKEIQKKELARCIRFMEAVGCKFKVITDDGEEFGTLEIAVAKERKRRPPAQPYGTLVRHYRPQLNLDAAVGSVQEIDCGPLPPDAVRSGLASALSKAWGRDSYVTAVKGNTVEVLRTM